MKSIVVPVDFTEGSGNAARYAADMAASINAELHLVHVLEIPAGSGVTPLPDSVLDELRDRGLNSLRLLADELSKRTNGKVSVATDQETGQPESRFEDFCQWKKPLLVVRGPSHTGRFPANQLPFPLLVVPALTRYHPVHRILLTFDREDVNPGMHVPVKYLQLLGDLFQARFDILHVATREEKISTLVFDDWKKGLDQQVSGLHIIQADSVDQGIRDYLCFHAADWLVVFPKKNGLFHLHSSLSQKIVLHCPVPVMNLHK
ncbi:MAG: universal stress protein [Puia sp.]|nr:universal stress protein [Puia sp.]